MSMADSMRGMGIERLVVVRLAPAGRAAIWRARATIGGDVTTVQAGTLEALFSVLEALA